MKKKLLLIGLWFSVLSFARVHATTCSNVPVDVEGQKLYEKCYCEEQTYPDLEQKGKEIGIGVVASAPSGFKDHYNCGVSFTWAKTKPQDLEECVKAKKEKIKQMETVRVLPENLSGLQCGESSMYDVCVDKRDIFTCARAQEEASKQKKSSLADTFKSIKCSNKGSALAKNYPDDLKDCE